MLSIQDTNERLRKLLDALSAFVVQREPENQRQLTSVHLDMLMRDLPFPLTDEALAYFQWCNQIKLRTVDQQLFPTGGLLYLENALDYYYNLSRLAVADTDNINGHVSGLTNDDDANFAFWQPYWFPVFEDGSGGFYVIWCGEQPAPSSPVYFVAPGDALATYLAYDSLSSLLFTLLVVYERHILFVDDTGYLQADRVAFIRLINQNNPYRQQCLYKAAGEAQTIADLVEGLASFDSQLSTKAYQALIHLADLRAVPLLIQQLQHKRAEVRRWAAIILGDIGDVSAIDQLLLLLEDESPNVQHAAVDALGQLKDPKADKVLISHLNTHDSTLRSSIIMALGSIRSVNAVGPLLALLDTEKLADRENAITALGEIGDPKAVNALIRMLFMNESHSRLRAITALAQIGHKSAIEPLQELSRHSDDMIVIQSTLDALRRLHILNQG